MRRVDTCLRVTEVRKQSEQSKQSEQLEACRTIRSMPNNLLVAIDLHWAFSCSRASHSLPLSPPKMRTARQQRRRPRLGAREHFHPHHGHHQGHLRLHRVGARPSVHGREEHGVLLLERVAHGEGQVGAGGGGEVQGAAADTGADTAPDEGRKSSNREWRETSDGIGGGRERSAARRQRMRDPGGAQRQPPLLHTHAHAHSNAQTHSSAPFLRRRRADVRRVALPGLPAAAAAPKLPLRPALRGAVHRLRRLIEELHHEERDELVEVP